MTSKSRRPTLIRSFSVMMRPAAMACVIALTFVAAVCAQDAGAPPSGRSQDGRPAPLFGKIAAIHPDSLDLTDQNGATVTVKLSDKTEFRKDRQPAKRADFKVGDIVIVRGQENPDHTWAAQTIAARSMNERGQNGRGGAGGGFGAAGTLGKDYVAGEIKSIDAPSLTVLRTDNVTQKMELNEETSLHKGRDSVTMADIQVGDHVFARGAVQNNVFVPKNVMVVDREQWKRMQDMAGSGPQGSQKSDRGAAEGATGATRPDSNSTNPPESPH
jgi:hypothetical protein